MWITPYGAVINDAEPYTSKNGTQYPFNFPKSEIPDLVAVTLTDRPATTQYQDAAYTIENGAQVWTVIGWTQERVTAYQKSLVPKSVTMKQARRALLKARLLNAAIAVFDAMEGTEGDAARIDFEFSPDVHRDSTLVLTAIAALGLTEDQADALFIAASEIE